MSRLINVADFHLAATLLCGQAFRWEQQPDGWFEGVVGRRVVRIRQVGQMLEGDDLTHYLALDASLPAIVATFPPDEALQVAVRQHWGMRVVRQEPWETLASFIASSTKQIVQIRQIVRELSRRFGEPIDGTHFAFPNPAVIAAASEAQLRACKLGFRAPYVLAAARAIDSGALDLAGLACRDYDDALAELTKLRGVGEKIAACTLLFGCGFHQAFPIDVWVERSLRRLYFSRRKRTPRQLREFARRHFGPHAGWAQQYLFFSERTRKPNTNP